MAQRGYRYVKPRNRIAGRNQSKKFAWILSVSGSRMDFGIRSLYDYLRQGPQYA